MINTGIVNLKRNQKEILELKTIITKMKNSLEGFQGRCKQVGERINELEDRTMKCIESEEQKEKRSKKSKQNPRDLWGIVGQTYISTWEFQKQEKEQGAERILERKKKTAENFPNLMKYMNIKIKEAHETPSRMNSETHSETQYKQTLKDEDRDS